MEYAVTGFPRIGIHRELKFTTEMYFRGETDENTLQKLVRQQRKQQWEKQKAEGATYISSNDYSLYDAMLDTAVMLHAIPKRYLDLQLSDTDTYFAMAKGYQGSAGDVKAFTMKKWFNTNYHYMVPELSDEMEIYLHSRRFLDGFLQARTIGIDTKPVVVGPFTFLKLANISGDRTVDEYAKLLTSAYQQVLLAANEVDVHWIQFDEPYLVMDLSKQDVALFESLYRDILGKKDAVKVLLQTYFGDVRDCYDALRLLPFDGIGLDFMEGKQTERLVTEHPLAEGQLLFAGMINGKNIWRSNYGQVLQRLRKAENAGNRVVLSTSCSLLHVPYTVTLEEKLSPDVKAHLAFAYEKLEEMREICTLFDDNDYESNPIYQRNQKLFAKNGIRTDADVRNRVAALCEEDFTRKTARTKRQELQREILHLPLLPTTTIGSFPQTKEVRANRTKFRKGEITKEQYDENVKALIRDCVALQEEIGLDVLVHGEFERNDMVEFFGENLSGYVFTENGWVQSYGTRGLKPPIIFGDIKREKSITTEYIAYANTLTDKDVKGMLTGPVTILNWSFPREDISTEEMMYQIGLAIREEVLELEASGVRIIQIDEAALREKLPLRRQDWHKEYLDFAIRAFRLCHAGVKPETQIHTHMCYSEFEDIIPEIDAMDADVITFEASRSKLTILDSLQEHHFETEVGPGVYDIHSPRVPTIEEMEEALRLMLEKIPAKNLWVNPDCGLKTRGNAETTASLKNMVRAAAAIRAELS